MKTMAWTGLKGQKIELRAHCETTMTDNIIDADGDKINLGKKPCTDANLELWVDDKKIDSCRDTNFWQIIDTQSGMKKIWGLPIGMADDQSVIVGKFLKDAIESGKSAEVVEYETVEANKEKAERKAGAQRIVAEAATYTKPLMTNAEYKVWRKNYNDIHNEGGEGYIPELITVEQLEYAKKILAESR